MEIEEDGRVRIGAAGAEMPTIENNEVTVPVLRAKYVEIEPVTTTERDAPGATHGRVKRVDLQITGGSGSSVAKVVAAKRSPRLPAKK